jgi:hypothetical protein
VELQRSEEDPHRWEGVYSIPASQLANAVHADVQLVFKGTHHGNVLWDNNAGKNWQARGAPESGGRRFGWRGGEGAPHTSSRSSGLQAGPAGLPPGRAASEAAVASLRSPLHVQPCQTQTVINRFHYPLH